VRAPAFAAIGLVCLAAAAAAEPVDQVDLFAGTAARTADFGTGGGAGNTFPGATAPFGMLQWSPDSVPGTTNFAGGYSWEDTRLRGFSLTHLSGAGCVVFQDVPILPTTVPVTASPSVAGTYDVTPAYLPAFDHAAETAEPGFYRVRLDPGTDRAIDVELAARTRSAVGRFTYPASASASLLFNAGGSGQANGDVTIRIDPVAGEVSGSVASGQFCYHRNRYTLYFVVRLDRPLSGWGSWTGQALVPGSTVAAAHSDRPFHLKGVPGNPDISHASTTAQAGVWVTVDTRDDPVVNARVGISFASLDGARANLDSESPDFDVDAARTATRAAWNQALGRVEVRGGDERTMRTFYTMLYHALVSPTVFSDVDGAYAGMDGQVHHTDGWTAYANFSGWDIYRSQIPLLALLDPQRTGDMMRSLLANARESGWLPRWPVANGQTDVLVGDPAAPIIATAWALGARGFDPAEALAALVKGATQTGTSSNASYVERQGLAEYLRLGWVPHDGTENSSGATTTMFGDTAGVWASASTTLEYTVADFAVARMAAALGNRALYRTFMRRAGGWRNLYNPASGYLEPRYASGSFKAGLDLLGGEGFAEGNAAQYTWMVPFDPAGLFARLGGRRAAAARLDGHLARLDEGPQSPYAFLGNEPELGVPWLYDWLGQPWKTQHVVRSALLTLFDDSPTGYPGNDDLGTMSAWYVFGALGFYPAVHGTGVLALASPLFPETVVHLAGGNLAIHAPAASPGVPYVRGLRVDGRRWDRPWLAFDAVGCGARLDFDLGPDPSPRWGAARPHEPPSFGPRARFPRSRAGHACGGRGASATRAPSAAR
jgi:predicted alpha-1,2-mannosidase